MTYHPLVPNPYLMQATWYIDPVHGNDLNNGTTTGTALKTWKAFAARMNEFGQVLSSQNTANLNVHWLASQPDNTDPVDLELVAHNLNFLMDGVLIQKDTGTFGTVTNINRPSFILTSAVASGKPSNYWTQYLGMLVHDTTANVWFMVDRDKGSGTAQLTCPFSGDFTNTLSPTLSPGTISSGDNYIVYDLPKIFAAQLLTKLGGRRFCHLLCTISAIEVRK